MLIVEEVLIENSCATIFNKIVLISSFHLFSMYAMYSYEYSSLVPSSRSCLLYCTVGCGTLGPWVIWVGPSSVPVDYLVYE